MAVFEDVKRRYSQTGIGDLNMFEEDRFQGKQENKEAER